MALVRHPICDPTSAGLGKAHLHDRNGRLCLCIVIKLGGQDKSRAGWRGKGISPTLLDTLERFVAFEIPFLLLALFALVLLVPGSFKAALRRLASDHARLSSLDLVQY